MRQQLINLLFLCLSSSLYAASPPMEQCYVVDKDGNSLIKPDHADSGDNPPNDPNAWIWVPYGACEQINSGDYNGITPEILDKLIPPKYDTED